MNADIFNAIAHSYHAAEATLSVAKLTRFPRHCVVDVACGRYNGPGIVVLEDGTPPGQLAVKIENDNVWRYAVTDCTPNTDRKTWPKWIKRRLARWKRLAWLAKR